MMAGQIRSTLQTGDQPFGPTTGQKQRNVRGAHRDESLVYFSNPTPVMRNIFTIYISSGAIRGALNRKIDIHSDLQSGPMTQQLAMDNAVRHRANVIRIELADIGGRITD